MARKIMPNSQADWNEGVSSFITPIPVSARGATARFTER